MGKLHVLSGRDACYILEQQGFQIVRQRGSHILVQRRIEPGTVPIPDHAELKIGML
ncbi:MAG: type II toxin-antitoxin system HicA family toxin [Nitrospira sp.]|nr:MAG: type II toxin-antitoxin system HicA family toxin [Nitrospira sp.]